MQVKVMNQIVQNEASQVSGTAEDLASEQVPFGVYAIEKKRDIRN